MAMSPATIWVSMRTDTAVLQPVNQMGARQNIWAERGWLEFGLNKAVCPLSNISRADDSMGLKIPGLHQMGY